MFDIDPPFSFFLSSILFFQTPQTNIIMRACLMIAPCFPSPNVNPFWTAVHLINQHYFDPHITIIITDASSQLR